MERGALLYEGKAKQVYASGDPRRVILHFKDDATAFNGVKKASIADKGRINTALTVHLFDRLAKAGIRHHLVEQLSPIDLLCERVEIVGVEVVVRNRVAGSFAKRYGLEEGTALAAPLVEFFVKSDALNDPLINEDAAVALGLAARWELAYLAHAGLQINRILQGFWNDLGIDLVDFKVEFGRHDGRLLLADEITADGARLWEQGTGRKLDKDVFRRDLADLGDTYRDLYQRVFGAALQRT
jgi:phosphoribosylaminoimidazole-succinocarboxamide synthase